MSYEPAHLINSSISGLKHSLKTRPVFIFLLPFFFVLHGVTRNYNSVPAGDAALLTLFYTGCTIVIAGIGWFIYRNYHKACLFAFFIMACHFFFGTIHDGLKELPSLSFLSKYRFLIPLGCLLLLSLAYWLKKRKRTLFSLTSYLNILLLILILMDTAWLMSKITGSKTNTTLNPDTLQYNICDSCSKPDIYFILLDQYAGSTALKDVFHFDNSSFENELHKRGFHIVKNSSSNYNLTPFSMASALNMDYLTPQMGEKGNLNVGYTYHMIRNSAVVKFLEEYGYRFYNYSVFDFPKQPAKSYSLFFPYGISLITKQTLINRLTDDIRFDILHGKFRFPGIQKKLAYEYLDFNNDIFETTCRIAAKQTAEPKFVYAHFMMPHFPYYFDSKGKPSSLEKLTQHKMANSVDYIEYLQYANGRILQLADSIMKVSSRPPVIMLISDHGFRHPGKETQLKYDFMNLNAIYLPDKNYGSFKDNLTNVNHFRTFFNGHFGQHFPLLKDSTINLY